MAAARKAAPGSRPAAAPSMFPAGPRPLLPIPVPLSPVPTPGLRVPVVAPPTVVVPVAPETLHGSISKQEEKKYFSLLSWVGVH